ncbi:hypothetical protein ACEPAF_1718 [Sanghuangporus sanghuang]
MVVTRSITKKCAAGDGSSGATASTRSYHNDHSTCAVIHEDAVRGAVDNHASACSRGAKSNSALLPTFFREGKSARTRSCSGVPPGTTSHGSGRRPTRARKQPPSVQAITKKSSSKPEVRSNDSMNKCRATAILSRHTSTIVVGSVEDRSEKEDKHHPSNRGVKRKRDEEEKVPTFAAGPCVNTRRIRRKAARSSVQDCKRSDRSRKTKGHENAPAKKKSVSRKRKRDHERANDVTEAPGPSRRVRGRALEGSDHSEGEDEGKSSSACGTSTESPQENLVNDKSSPLKTSGPGSDEASPLPSSLSMNGDLVSEPTRPSSRGLSRGRHIPSIEPLLTPPQYIKEEEEEIVLINQDLDTMIPLASRDAEEDGASVVLTHLPQLGDEEPGDEQSIEADDDAHDHIVTNRYRSLAPEPDQGLINAIRSGEIPGLTSPPPSMHEAS